MRRRYNYDNKSDSLENNDSIKSLDKEKILDNLLKYIKYEKHYSIVNIDVTMKEGKYLLKKYNICQFDIETAHKIEDDMNSRGLASKTIINRLYDFELMAAANGITLTIKKPKKIKTKKEYLSIPESRALLEAAQNTRDKAIIAMILYTGIRVTSLTSITMDCIDLTNRTIIVRQGTKNYSEYKVILSKQCVEILREYLKCRPQNEAPQLFLNCYGEKLHARSITRIIKNIAIQAGIEKRVFAHMLRTTCGTNMIKAGVPITEVALQLGHTNLNSTMIYLVGNEDDLRKSIDDRYIY